MTDELVPDGTLAAAARLLARRVGLRLDPAIRGRLSRCVAEEATAHRVDAADYVGRLDEDPALLQDLLNRVTVQETSFFRDPGQFAALRTILPEVTSPLTIWSAGCANGQEPYSLAMTLAEAGVPAWQIVATDLSTRALSRTRKARYAERELRGLDDGTRDRHLFRVGSEWQVTDALRTRVEARHHNLVAEPPPFEPGTCDVVFCRNVLIYFRQEDVVAFLERLALWMRPGAWLFLGYSESLWQVTDRFQLVRVGDSFVYRHRDPHERPAQVALDRQPATRNQNRRPRPAPAPRAPRPRPDRPHVTFGRTGADSAPDGPKVEGGGVKELLAAGEAAMNEADYPLAVATFRKAAYIDPDQPVAHLHLGLALEAAGEAASARRAFGAARAGLDRSGTAAVEAVLEGYHVDELVRLLDAKLRASA
ncbi:MAG: protein-glutamate O-methyltransferase CheR [Actinobacteria bacterium]|nr:protein-glutamate O-methyltransferase CheR [Actinomycetota bacterium]